MIAPTVSSWMHTYSAHPVQSTYCYFKKGNDKSGEETSCNLRKRCRIQGIFSLRMCLCHKQWEPVLLRAGSSRTDHTIFQCISDNWWGGRSRNGKGVSLNFERGVGLKNLYSFYFFFFHSKVKWKEKKE